MAAARARALGGVLALCAAGGLQGCADELGRGGRLEYHSPAAELTLRRCSEERLGLTEASGGQARCTVAAAEPGEDAAVTCIDGCGYTGPALVCSTETVLTGHHFSEAHHTVVSEGHVFVAKEEPTRPLPRSALTILCTS